MIDLLKILDEHDIKPGKKLRVNVSIANTRLFIGNIPKAKSKDEIFKEFSLVAEMEGVRDVIIYADADDPENKKNCGYCFVEFVDHKSASTAKRRLADGHVRPWNCNVVANWAEPQEEPDEETMSQVKTIFIKNLRESCTEDIVRKAFGLFGEVYKCRRVKDYAFVYYNDRESALKAIEKMNNKEFHGCIIEVCLAKPQSESRKKAMQSRVRRGFEGMPRTPYDMYPAAYGGYYEGFGPAPGYGYGYGYGYDPSAMAGPRPMPLGYGVGGAAAGASGRAAGAGMGGGLRAKASPGMAAQYRMRGAMGAGTGRGLGAMGSAASYGGGRGGIPVKRTAEGGTVSDAKRRFAAEGYGAGAGTGYWGVMGGAAGRPY